jgi:Putative transposase
VPYFHVVFTLPHALGALIRVNPRRLYNLLFRTATATLQEFAADPKHLGAELGITAVLHTWGQTLTQHVHLHCVVTGGGLGRDGRRWVALPKRRRRSLFLFPVRALSAVFRRTFCHQLDVLWQQGELRFAGQCASLRGRVEWARLRHTLESIPWVVYAKRPFGGPEVVLKYLSRYTHRVAISNRRILFVGDGAVRFAYRDYADGNRHKVMELRAEEFLRRFLLHVLPPGFKRIRHFGLLANRHRRHKIERSRQLLGQPPSANLSVPELATAEPSDSHSHGATPAPTQRRCEACGSQRLRTIELLPPIRPGPAPP